MTAPADTNHLREALEKIASENTQWDWKSSDSADVALSAVAVQMRYIARAALASEPVAGTVRDGIQLPRYPSNEAREYASEAITAMEGEIYAADKSYAVAQYVQAFADKCARPALSVPPAPAGREPTEAETNSVCMSFRHDFGLLPESNRQHERFIAREWLRAWQKEGYAIPPQAGATTASAPPGHVSAGTRREIIMECIRRIDDLRCIPINATHDRTEALKDAQVSLRALSLSRADRSAVAPFFECPGCGRDIAADPGAGCAPSCQRTATPSAPGASAPVQPLPEQNPSGPRPPGERP